MKKVTSFQLGLKIFGSCVAAAIIGIMINFMLFNAFSEQWSAILMQTIDFLLLFCIAYSTAWRDGYSEMNRVQVGFITYDSTKGLKAGCFAIIPGLLLTLALAVTHYTSVDWMWIYRIINFYAIGYINEIIDPNLALSAIPVWRILLSGVYWLLIPLLSWCAFILGFRRFSMMELFYFKKKRTDNKEKEKTVFKK